MKIYLDTNVLLAYFIPKDPNHRQMVMILGQKDFEYYVSSSSILEFTCKIAAYRTQNEMKFNEDFENSLKELTPAAQIKTIVEYCFAVIGVKIISDNALEKYRFNAEEYLFENTTTIALKMAPMLVLRTLDLIQIASAMKIRLYSKIDIQYFLTGDQKILDKANEIYQMTKFLPINGENLIRIMKIKPHGGSN